MPQAHLRLASAETLIDIHCHRYHNAGHVQILSRDTHEFFNNPRTLTSDSPESLITAAAYFSLGIHPWFIDRQNIDTAFRTLESYRHHPRLIAVGECGLDKCIDTPMIRQIQVFGRQIELAERIGKPLIVHCVRAFAELLQLKKNLAPCQDWIVHGFAGKPALAAQLIKHGCHISFGKAILPTGSQAGQALQNIPIERLFLETDAADASIDTIYAAAATIRGIEPADLRRQIHTNFLNVFLND
ncbi:TatD family hydrolase [Methylomonas rivi]|uniref:TatD family hydrolase n=1 Tax=Methylomonas rivi TaxID=2952226 RepID=A0ABT1TZV8_9GAMM|nr:TatD family hydrolase [Methylomonas sp. WSC-6]MCQ8127093.1 TatD family hydrolase [Methylomonas sp. WSC-6]